jgi:hypothetical protein
MASILLTTAVPRGAIALGVVISCMPLQAQNTMAGNGSGSSNGGTCTPGLNCDPCDTDRGRPIIENPGPGSSGTKRIKVPPGGSGEKSAGVPTMGMPTVGGPRLKLVPIPTWSALGGSPAKVTYCVAVSIQNVGNASWQAPLNLKLVDQQEYDYPGENPSSPGIPLGVYLNQLPVHVQQNSLPTPASVPIAPGATLTLQLLTPCVTIDWYKRPALVITADDTKLSCPVNFGPPSSRRPTPSGTVQRPTAASSNMTKQ